GGGGLGVDLVIPVEAITVPVPPAPADADELLLAARAGGRRLIPLEGEARPPSVVEVLAGRRRLPLEADLRRAVPDNAFEPRRPRRPLPGGACGPVFGLASAVAAEGSCPCVAVSAIRTLIDWTDRRRFGPIESADWRSIVGAVEVFSLWSPPDALNTHRPPRI